MTIKELLNKAFQQLTSLDSARLDAEILLAFVLDWPRSRLISQSEATLSQDKQKQFEDLINRRIKGEPVAYIIEQREFWSLPIYVNSDVLIPRPETELLVETTLSYCKDIQTPTILDLGTGSGCIALAIQHEFPYAQILASDISDQALQVAQNNANKLGLDKISFIKSNWFSNITEQKFDFIVSNPPYIRESSPYLNSNGLNFEPKIALTSGPIGLEAINHISLHAKNYLKETGFLLMEIGYDQTSEVNKLLQSLGYKNIQFKKDLNNIERVCIAGF